MEGVEEDSRVWIWESGVGADWAGGWGQGMWLRHRCVGSGTPRVEVTSRHLEGPGESLGPPPTSSATPSLSTEMEAQAQPLPCWGSGSGGCLHLASHLYCFSSSSPCQGEPHGGVGLPGWEGAMGVASQTRCSCLATSLFMTRGCPGQIPAPA